MGGRINTREVRNQSIVIVLLSVQVQTAFAMRFSLFVVSLMLLAPMAQVTAIASAGGRLFDPFRRRFVQLIKVEVLSR